MKKIFALDIGTRSVVGVILEKTDASHYAVADLLIEEHKERRSFSSKTSL